jgi:hypothetical protein
LRFFRQFVTSLHDPRVLEQLLYRTFGDARLVMRAPGW